MRLILASALAASSAGCFSYVETPIESAALGADYRLLLTRPKMDQLRELDGSGLPDAGPPLLRGTLVQRDGTEIVFRVPVASRQVGFHQNGIDRQIRLSRGDIVDVERRQLDRGRTGLAVAGLGGLALGVVFSIVEGARFWDQNPDSPLPEALRGTYQSLLR